MCAQLVRRCTQRWEGGAAEAVDTAGFVREFKQLSGPVIAQRQPLAWATAILWAGTLDIEASCLLWLRSLVSPPPAQDQGTHALAGVRGRSHAAGRGRGAGGLLALQRPSRHTALRGECEARGDAEGGLVRRRWHWACPLPPHRARAHHAHRSTTHPMRTRTRGHDQELNRATHGVCQSMVCCVWAWGWPRHAGGGPVLHCRN